MSTVNLKKSTSLRIDHKLYEYIERLAKKQNRSVNNFIETVLADATNFNTPNEETQKAIKAFAEEKSELKKYENTKDLLDDLMKD